MECPACRTHMAKGSTRRQVRYFVCGSCQRVFTAAEDGLVEIDFVTGEAVAPAEE
jgi:hypothetical protein